MIGRGREIEALGLVAGFAVWSLGFAVLYGAHGLACGLGIAPGPGRAALGLLFAAFLAAHLGLIAWLRQRLPGAPNKGARFVRRLSLVLAIAAMGATIWTGFPSLALRICS